MAWAALGFEMRNDSAKAIDCEKRSISVNSQFAPAWNYLGGLLTNKKDYAGAEDAYQTALSLTWLKSDRIYIFKRLGDAFEDDQKYSQAAAAYQSSLALDPRQADAQTKLGQSLMHANQPDAAAAAFQTAISLQPTNSDAYLCLGMISQGTGFDSDAIGQYRNALKADPNSILALNNLAWIMATDSDPALRNGSEAVSLAECACRLTHYQDAVYIGTLAAAYAEAGRFDDAVTTAQRAHDVALAHGDDQRAARNAQLLQIYKSHHAYHSASPKN
jgi:tetratricopeptide (TPR) repeat protein